MEGPFNGGFFALPDWGAYTWRGLFSEFYGSFLRVICLKVRSDCKWIEGCAYVSVMRVWESYLINNAAICQDSGNNFQSLPLDTSRFLLQNPYCISSTSVST